MSKKWKKIYPAVEIITSVPETTGPFGKIIGDAKQITDLIPGKSYSSVWETPESFSRYIENLKQKDAWDDSAWENVKSFAGTEDMPEAIDLMKNGWHEGADMISKLRDSIQASKPQAPKFIRYGMAGSTPNVPRAVAGNILNMRAQDLDKARRRPVITLISNMAANCGVSADAITNRAAVVAALIDEIESAGYACEVIATAPSAGGWGGGSGFTAATSVLVKNSNQPVDTVRLAFSLGHASMFRRMIFADWETEPLCEDGLGRSLGHSSDNELEGNPEKGIYIIPSAEGCAFKFATPEKAMTEGLAHIIDSLKAQGCPAFPGQPSSALTEEEIDF